MLQLSAHSYEEIRDVVIDIILRREKVEYEPNQYRSLVTGAGQVLARRGTAGENRPLYGRADEIRLHNKDVELVVDLEVFWLVAIVRYEEGQDVGGPVGLNRVVADLTGVDFDRRELVSPGSRGRE